MRIQICSQVTQGSRLLPLLSVVIYYTNFLCNLPRIKLLLVKQAKGSEKATLY